MNADELPVAPETAATPPEASPAPIITPPPVEGGAAVVEKAAEVVKELSEAVPEAPHPPAAKRSRLTAAGRYTLTRIGSACDRALILLIALGLLALLKGCAGKCGLPVP